MATAASTRRSVWKIAREALWEGGPGVCHFSITNACNARCAFCSFAYDRLPAAARQWVTLADARETCDILRRNGIRFPVQNPVASIEDMQRHLRGEPEVFGCLAGWKYFYLDWNLQIWRCHHWDRPLCHIRDFDGSQRVRDGCTACMVDCYRDASVMQHVGVALSDGLRAAARGEIRQAWGHWADRRNLVSVRSAIRTARVWTRVS